MKEIKESFWTPTNVSIIVVCFSISFWASVFAIRFVFEDPQLDDPQPSEKVRMVIENDGTGKIITDTKTGRQWAVIREKNAGGKYLIELEK